jgi:Holliday junction resolvase
MTDSRKKGSRFELEICKKLTKHFKKEFVRAPSSGAWATINDVDHSGGDIICKEDFDYTIECKCNYGFSLFNLVQGNKKENKLLDEWTKQVERDCKREGKKPLIIYKRDRRGTFVVTKNKISCDCCILYKKWFIYPIHTWLEENKGK